MAKYKRKPTITEAWQFDEQLPNACPMVLRTEHVDYPTFFIETHHGQVGVVTGDWIIKDIRDGKYYPCKDDVFKELYEPMLEDLVEAKDTKEFFPLNEYCPNCKTNYLVINRKNQKWCSWNECGWGRKNGNNKANGANKNEMRTQS